MKLITQADKDSLKETHFFVTYSVLGKDLDNIAWDIAIGQSVGNPNIRSRWETEELFINHSCKIVNIDRENQIVEIAFPYVNLDWNTDGVAQLLCMIQGGQTDISHVHRCSVIGLEAPKLKTLQPKYGISGFRKFVSTRSHDGNRPFLGGIVKPKTGINKYTLLEMIKEMVDGGVDFIKEDGILSNPAFCTIEERVPLVMNYLAGKAQKVIYSVCINSDPAHILNRVNRVHELGGNSIHLNFWSGLGAYKSIRELDLPIFIHYQKSGIETICNPDNKYFISWKVICQLAGMCGVDSIHAGMVGGYSDNKDIKSTIEVLHSYNVLPALSCGMHPGLVSMVNNTVGVDYMANVGGALHGHPGGTLAGTRAMRQAINEEYGQEYKEAVKTWGYINANR